MPHTDEIEEESNDRQTNPYFIYSNRLISLQKAKTGHNTWIIINSGFLFYFLIVLSFGLRMKLLHKFLKKKKLIQPERRKASQKENAIKQRDHEKAANA